MTRSITGARRYAVYVCMLASVSQGIAWQNDHLSTHHHKAIDNQSTASLSFPSLVYSQWAALLGRYLRLLPLSKKYHLIKIEFYKNFIQRFKLYK